MRRLARRVWIRVTWPLRLFPRADVVAEAEIIRLRSARA